MMDLNLAPFFNIEMRLFDLKQTEFEININAIRFFNARFQFSLIYPKGTDFVVYVFSSSWVPEDTHRLSIRPECNFEGTRSQP